jgi:hypothetical protein
LRNRAQRFERDSHGVVDLGRNRHALELPATVSTMGGQETLDVPAQRIETPEQPLRTALGRTEPNDPVVLVDRDEIDLSVVAILRTTS